MIVYPWVVLGSNSLSTGISVLILYSNDGGAVPGFGEQRRGAAQQFQGNQEGGGGVRPLPEATVRDDGVLLDHRIFLPDPTLLLLQNARLLQQPSNRLSLPVPAYFCLNSACD